LKTWRESGMSGREIVGAMRRSELFRDIPGGDQLALVAAEGFNINLGEQALAADKSGVLGILPAAREVFLSAGKNRLAVSAEAEVRKLVGAGKYEEAQARVKRFIDSDESGFSPEMRGQLHKRLETMQNRLTRRVAALPEGGTAGLFERGPARGLSPLEDVRGDVNAARILDESSRAEATGVTGAVDRSTAAPYRDAQGRLVPGGPLYQAAGEADVRTRATPSAEQLAGQAVARKTQELTGRATTKTPDGSDTPIKVIIVNDLRERPPPPIESSSRSSKRYEYGWSEITRLFGG